MGTNYYAIDRCECCGREDRIHIGKSSAGWAFAIHVIPELNLLSIGDWSVFLAEKHIEDEYGREVTLQELLDVIQNRSWKGSPDNLHRGSGDRRVGHGKGTYDYFIGEFS